MFNRLKDRAKITDQDPIFKAKYIGFTETFTASGKGCTTPLVQRLWDNAEEERYLKRVTLKITSFGIHMRNMDKKKVPERLFQIENISFCNVDIIVNERIFSWISREADDKMWECHAVICSSPEKAKSLALVLTRAFHIAYKEWKALQTREIRSIERQTRSQSLSTMSLEKKSKSKVKQTVPKQLSLDAGTTLVNGTSSSTTNGIHARTNQHDAVTKIDGRDSVMTESLDLTFSDKSDVSSVPKNSDMAVQTEMEEADLRL